MWHIPRTIVALANGKLVAGGSYTRLVRGRSYDVLVEDDRTTQTGIFVARYNYDGSPDVSFAGAGRLMISPPDENTWFTSIGVMRSGSIVVAGGRNHIGRLDSPVLMVIDAAGQIDSSFTGRAARAWSTREWSIIGDLAMLDDDSILALRHRNTDVTLERYLMDGSRDETFLGGREVSVEIPAIARPSVVRDGRGGFLVVWCAGRGSKTQLRRFTASGELDTHFGTAGVAEVELCVGDPGTVEVDSVGRIVLVGVRNGSGIVVRLREDGVADETLGEHGFVIFGNDIRYLSSVLPLGENRLVIGGASTSGSGDRMIVAWLE